MAKKVSGWKTKGMNRDLSVSAFNPEFAFENMNLRLATNDGNTVMSWVNEKGTAPVSIVDKNGESLTIQGTAIGTAVLNKYLVLFITDAYNNNQNDTLDKIFRLEYIDSEKTVLKAIELYSGNLGFKAAHPLETLTSYESEAIQKVYWTDGINQPRLINIADLSKTYSDTSFDFITTLKLQEDIKVKKVLGGGGMFAPGVIQYCFTYFNKYGQESNIFYTTPLYYISHQDRGGSPEDKIDNIFKITVSNVDINFDYLRIYSIQRTSINGTPICKRIQDIKLSDLTDNKASYTDTGLNGNTIDPTELLYKGGSSILVGTMEQKDNTLFMGDLYTQQSQKPKLEEADIAAIRNSLKVDTRKFYPMMVSSDNYEYASQLTAYEGVEKTDENNNKTLEITNSVPCAGFKYGNKYRCGIQLQDKWGRWTDPIFLDDIEIEDETSGQTVKNNHPNIDIQLEPVGRYDMISGFAITNTTNHTIKIRNEAYIAVKDVSGNCHKLTLKIDAPDEISLQRGVHVEYSAELENSAKYLGATYCTLEEAATLGMGSNVVLLDANDNDNELTDVTPSAGTGSGIFTGQAIPNKGETAWTYTMYCNKASEAQDDPTPVDPDPGEDVPALFKTLITEFNNEHILANNITKGTDTWDYLLAAFNMAEDEWKKDADGLFVAANSEEIYNYRGYEYTYYDTAHQAMQAWLMAMCLSELSPTSGQTTNNQTRLYKKAYEYVGGKNIPLYGDFLPKGDVMLARLVAGAIYAKNRAAYSFSDMDVMRTEVGGSVIDDTSMSWSDLGTTYNGKALANLGYSINLDSIFPAAPGPYITNYSTHTHPSSQGQPSNLFYGSGNTESWKDLNYIVDTEVDGEVTDNYNLANDDTYLARTVQAKADDFDKAYHWFAEKTYYEYSTGGTTSTQGQSVPNPRFTFQAGSTGGRHYFTGTFGSEVTGKDLSSLVDNTSVDRTKFETFVNLVSWIGGNGRMTLNNPQYGRRRPAMGTTDESARIESGSLYKYNFLDDDSIERLVGGGTVYDANGGAHSYYIDKNGNAQWDTGEPYYGEHYSGTGGTPDHSDLWPAGNLHADTYASGHSSGCWTLALYMIQFFPDQYREIFQAAYAFSVSRTILRAHWNSDITYGRLIGCMYAPILNARRLASPASGTTENRNFRTLYQEAYSLATGGSSEDGIKFVITNNCGREARFTGKVILNISKDPDDWDNSVQVNANIHEPTVGTSWAYNDIIIPAGGTYTSPEITTIDRAQMPGVDFLDGTWYFMNADNGPYGHTIFLYTREYSRSRDDYSGSNHMFWTEPLQNTVLKSGRIYYLDLQYTNDKAMLANADTTKTDFINNMTEYNYAILAEGKTSLVE